MGDTSSPLGWATWRRGAVLGLQWLAVFVCATLGVYGLMGMLGWSGTLRALCAMGIGPLIAIGLIAAWWIVRRPVLVPRSTNQPDSQATDDNRTGSA